MSEKTSNEEIVNRLITYAIPGGIFRPMRDFPRSAFGVSIPVANIDQYYDGVRELFARGQDIKESYAIKSFEKRVLAFIAPYVKENRTAEKMEVRAFMRELREAPVHAQDVYRPIYGVQIEDGVGPVVLGPFTIYDPDKHLAALDEVMTGRRETLLRETDKHYLIRTRVQSREEVNALELGDVLFERFEAALRCMLGPGSQYSVSILNSAEPAHSSSIVLNPVGGFAESKKPSTVPALTVSDPILVNSEYGFGRFWECFSASETSDLTKKLLLAVDWIGQSIAERVPASAFIKAAIALEVLFTAKKESIAGSITSQISETVAMLLGTDIESRFKIEKEARDLYGIRSTVAHEGKADVSYESLYAIQHMARDVVIKILTSESLKTVATATELQQLFKSQKYGSAPLT